MKTPALSVLTLLLASGLLSAAVQRETVTSEGEWEIFSCTENGKPAGAEMRRTYDGKHEFHLRLHTDDSGVYVDATRDWSALPDAKTHSVELRVNSPEGDPLWTGTGRVITDPDGLPWLRVPLGKSAAGDQTEAVLSALMEGGKKLFLTVGADTEWEFDLKGASPAYDAMFSIIQNGSAPKKAAPEKKPAGPAPKVEPVEHEYARPGDWAVHYYTNAKSGDWIRSSMIRFYDSGSMLRMGIDAGRFTVDLAADWKALESSDGRKGDTLPVYIVLGEQDDGSGINANARIINDGGDKWLRLTQPMDEPGGLQDIVRNGRRMVVNFSADGRWTFDLKGSNAAWQKVEESLSKYYKN